MDFLTLSKVCEELTETSKRNLMVQLISEFLRQLKEEEVEPAVSMILGRPFPKWDPRDLDVSWATLANVIKRLTKTDWGKFSEVFRGTGDIGSTVQIVFESSKIHRQATLIEKPLTISEVRRVLEAIADNTGQGSRERKERLVETLIGRAKPLEAKYIVKIMIGEMRTGFHEGLMEQAVSKAFNIPLKTIQTATMLTGDIGEVAEICKKEGKEGILKVSFQIFRPVKPMLAQTVNNTGDALKEHGGKTAFEYKLDGARVQIHKSGDRVKIFSRRLTDVTRSFPDIVQRILGGIKAHDAVIEGEVIAIGKDGHPLPFQHLMRRFRRVYDIEKKISQIPVDLYLFDVLYVNSETLINKPYTERREKLKDLVTDLPLTEQMVTDDPKKADLLLRDALNKGHEGLMAKRLDSPYFPGVRGKHWFKIKKPLEPLDLVIVAAEYGYGRRHGWLSDYYLAARDEESGELLTVGKTFKGLTDKEIIEMTKRLKQIALREEGHRVIVSPKIVVEVAYNEIQKSPKYKCGMALRFARITRIRDDKEPEEADTIQKVRQIYEKQFEKKARMLHI